MKKCNKDCFNCEFPDCVRSESADINVYVKRWIETHQEQYKAIRARHDKKYYFTHKEQECERLAVWRKNNPQKVKRSLRKSGKKWCKAHREEERERNRMNYLKRKERQAG